MTLTLLLGDSAFHFLVGLLEFVNFSGWLCLTTSSLIRSLGSTRGSVGFLPTEVLLQGTIGLVLLAIPSAMGNM